MYVLHIASMMFCTSDIAFDQCTTSLFDLPKPALYAWTTLWVSGLVYHGLSCYTQLGVIDRTDWSRHPSHQARIASHVGDL